MSTIVKIFPALERIKTDPDERIALVSDTIIEEVLQDVGTLDFGDKVQAPATVALWRTRGEPRPPIGELSFQIKSDEWKELSRDAMKRAEAFFIALPFSVRHWTALAPTKTGISE